VIPHDVIHDPSDYFRLALRPGVPAGREEGRKIHQRGKEYRNEGKAYIKEGRTDGRMDEMKEERK
jgi:hypothetical protein